MNMQLRHGHNSGLDPTPEVTNIRAVTRADLAHLTVKRDVTAVQTLRDNHHRIARAVASGLSLGDVASTCGVSYNRVTSLKADPSFQELVAHYRAIITSEWAQQDTVIEFLRGNALKAQAMISDKLDAAAEANEFLPTRDLLGIAELGLDRTGYGKVNKNVNINVDFAAKLEAARNRSAQAREPITIDGANGPALAPSSAEAELTPPRDSLPRPSFRRV